MSQSAHVGLSLSFHYEGWWGVPHRARQFSSYLDHQLTATPSLTRRWISPGFSVNRAIWQNTITLER
ncbi:hypothetical protein PsYK624_100000 [Phanerochaete sordida]|uniref:Uncharacterized protein n=1 Tax=Phanerochaete sordida TaxID=48140 RepID=A0A9P3LFS5_9APHY|nr:hypothetical protein PsYK624_100000 [Phanerochaete sordida]